MKFTHLAAYKMLLKYQQAKALSQIVSSDIQITDEENDQVLIGTLKDQTLHSIVYNLRNSSYNGIFDSLCASCSSTTPMIIKHKIISDDLKIFEEFMNSRLFQFTSKFDYIKETNTILANINYEHN